jgi:transposase-like protein
MLSGAVAKRLGVKTSTLKKWRSVGKGPEAWRRVSTTVVVYLVSGVSEFERKWGAQLDGTELS